MPHEGLLPTEVHVTETKKTTKKLTLQAQTVRVLNPAELQNVVGGMTTYVTCGCKTTVTCTVEC